MKSSLISTSQGGNSQATNTQQDCICHRKGLGPTHCNKRDTIWMAGTQDQTTIRQTLFLSMEHELTVEDGIVYKGQRVDIPRGMRSKMKEMLHASHLGVEMSKKGSWLHLFATDERTNLRLYPYVQHMCVSEQCKNMSNLFCTPSKNTLGKGLEQTSRSTATEPLLVSLVGLVGLVFDVTHSIQLTDDIPVRSAPYGCPWSDHKFTKEEITQSLTKSIVSHSASQYASPCIVVHRPHHPSTPLRLRTNIRKLDQKMIKHRYLVRRINDVLDWLASSKYFTTGDIKKGFLNVPIQEQDHHETAFGTLGNHLEYSRKSFNLCNAPATMQAAMDRHFDNFKWPSELVLYKDDKCIHTTDPTTNNEIADQVLKWLVQIGLKVNMKKRIS